MEAPPNSPRDLRLEDNEESSNEERRMIVSPSSSKWTSMRFPQMTERHVHLFYKTLKAKATSGKCSSGKIMCVVYKFDCFVWVESLERQTYMSNGTPCHFFQCAACIMEYRGNFIPKKQLRHTATQRLHICPLYTFMEQLSGFERREKLVRVLRKNGCKGPRSSNAYSCSNLQLSSRLP